MYEDTHEELLNVRERIENFFDGESNPNYGDRGYQDLLERQESLEEELNGEE